MAGMLPEDPEFSRRLALDVLGDRDVERRIAATAEERRALAARLNLTSLDLLDAVLTLRRPLGGDLLRARGRFEAELTQACVVTLEPVRDRIARDFALVYSLAPEGGRAGAAIEGAAIEGAAIEGAAVESAAVELAIDVDVEREDPPEALDATFLDLGEAVVQQLAVAIDPYPRAAGADLERLEWSARDAAERRRVSPFHALEALKRR